jgi:hypothetical protein
MVTRKRERERERVLAALAAFVLFPFSFHEVPRDGMVLPTFRTGLLPLLIPLWKCPHGHTQKCAFLVF